MEIFSLVDVVSRIFLFFYYCFVSWIHTVVVTGIFYTSSVLFEEQATAVIYYSVSIIQLKL